VVEAIEAAREEARRAPKSGSVWGRLGMTLLTHYFVEEAYACLAQAERLDPTEPRWPFFQGVILLRHHPDPAAAARKFQRTVDLCPDLLDAPRLQLAEVLLGPDRGQEARGHLRRLLTGNPAHPRAHLVL